MYSSFTATSLALLASVTLAEYRLRKCPTYTNQENFDVTLYTGHWFEVVKDMLNFYELTSGCTMADYELNDDGSVGVHNTGDDLFKGWGGIYGKAVTSNVTGSASLVVEFFSEPDPNQPGNYNILGTDYDNYTIVYNCEEKYGGFVAYDTLGILSRTMVLSDEKLAEAQAIIAEKIPDYHYARSTKMTRQGNDTCDYSKAPV